MKRKPPSAPAIIPPQPRVVSLTKLDPVTRRVFATPQGFCRLYLKMKLSDEQGAILNSMGRVGSRVSTVCCNEAGKTTRIICGFVLWHLSVFRRRGDTGGVLSTSGSWRQIKDQLVPSLRGYQERFPSWEFTERDVKINGIPNWMAFSTRDPGRAEGSHGDPEHPLAVVVDECKSVRDGILRALEDRCRPQRLAYLSSAGYATGLFYDSQTSLSALYERHKMTFEHCPWIDRDDMRRIVTKAGNGDYEKGLQDPLIRSAYFADFMPFVEGGLLTMPDIEDCLTDPPAWGHGGRHAWCDFARGGDENVLAVRNGNRVWIVEAWRDKNTMSAAGQFIAHFQRLKNEIGLKPSEIEGDADGLGAPVLDRIRECGWPILEYHANGAAFQSARYKNRASECWCEGAEKIKERRCIIPDDPELKGQMMDRQVRFHSSGLRWIESKDDLFKRQRRDGRPVRSPDRADALFGALADLPMMQPTQVMGEPDQRGPWANDPDMGEIPEHGAVTEEMLRGFDAG